MIEVQKTPDAVAQYQDLGGALTIKLFEDASADRQDHARALAAAIGTTDADDLARLAPHEIDEATFHGAWFDTAAQRLVQRGVWEDQNGRRQQDPWFSDHNWVSGSNTLPALWDPGNFAFAFCHPPNGLGADSREIERLYLDVCAILLPAGPKQILNWHGPDLVRIAPDLEEGTEWWGVFAFTIHCAEQNRIAAIAGAATD